MDTVRDRATSVQWPGWGSRTPDVQPGAGEGGARAQESLWQQSQQTHVEAGRLAWPASCFQVWGWLSVSADFSSPANSHKPALMQMVLGGPLGLWLFSGVKR